MLLKNGDSLLLHIVPGAVDLYHDLEAIEENLRKAELPFPEQILVSESKYQLGRPDIAVICGFNITWVE